MLKSPLLRRILIFSSGALILAPRVYSGQSAGQSEPLYVSEHGTGEAGSAAGPVGDGAAAAGESAEAADSTSSRLGEVVVTAQKRAENLQQVPISVQVISSAELAQQNQNSLADLTQTVPAVTVQPAGFSNSLFIRGVGSGATQSFDQSVAIFTDDIYHGRSRNSAATFLDLEHVEVLKGPQTTFFGNNAIAGALNIVTKKPGQTFEAWGRALYGMFGQYALEGAVGGPLSSVFGARLAVTGNGSGGWIDNVNLGEHVPRINDRGGRLTLLFHPGDELHATLKVEAGQHRVSGSPVDYPFQIANNCPPPAPFILASYNLGFCQLALNLKVPIGLDRNENAGLAGQGDSFSYIEDVLTVDYHLPHQTITSVTGFYNYHFNETFDAESLPVPLVTADSPEKYHQVSQELRIASESGQPFEYLAGAYYQTDKLSYTYDLNFPFLTVPLESAIPPLAAFLPLGEKNSYVQDEHSYSVFGSLSWNVTDKLKLTSALRWSEVRKSFNREYFVGQATTVYGGVIAVPAAIQPVFAAIGFPPIVTPPGATSDSAWMPSARIQYQLHSATMLYLSYTRGFKAGGFNGNDVTGDVANAHYKPEYVNAYEAGLKSEWLDDRLRINLAVFHSNYRDLQVASVLSATDTRCGSAGAFCNLVQNAATSVSQGVELESAWVLSRAFRVSTNVTYLESHYVNYPAAALTTLQSFLLQQGLRTQHSQDLSGSQTPYAPRWSGNVAATYTATLPADFRFITELSPYWTSNYYQNILDQWTGAYTRLDGRLALEAPSGNWTLDLIGKNLTNRTIPMFGPGGDVGSKERPRNIAVQFEYRW